MNRKALVMRNIVIAIIVLIILGLIIYISFGPVFMEVVSNFFNKTGETGSRAGEYRPGEIISYFNLDETGNSFQNLILNGIT
jgi:cell division protein FtsN